MRTLFGAVVVVTLLSVITGCDASRDTDLEPPQFTTLQRGEATVRCRDGDEYPRRPVADITTVGLYNLLTDCDLSELVLFYEGEIDPSFSQMMRVIAAREWPYERRVLFIHSAGGDVEAALQVGEVLSQEAWGVYVARTGEASLTNARSTARCYSACVFLLAAGRERIVQGEVGIHRIYPSGSSASSREELAIEVEAIVQHAKTFLTRNGVSSALVDDMMSVPSSDIRVLSRDELDRYGLGDENAAQMDLERLDLERRCGVDFVQRLQTAEQEKTQTCFEQFRLACQQGNCSAANDALNTCVNEVNRRYGFPDPICPADGPYYYCEADRVARSCAGQN